MTNLISVGQIGIPVRDIDRAISFYKDLLDLPLLFKTDTMAFFDSDGVRLMLSLPETEQFANASSVLYFQVDDITASYERLAEKEVTFTGEPHLVTKIGSTETWMVFFNDTEGNTHALMSELAV
ncbi:VOC family protein [Sporosarcina sp. JAI121]|uniref:VOC family protein n=1 Tax=Sporosarcina sp. JAI121 TaxID=2723064 RepID=UPI0015C95AE8|nr:VOC family protein [Sporosarcina sp. JAI121]NYF25591.1 putative enzyme related to lactoylglutathione lyase [Sporosarcina sp. JAI121]